MSPSGFLTLITTKSINPRGGPELLSTSFTRLVAVGCRNEFILLKVHYKGNIKGYAFDFLE